MTDALRPATDRWKRRPRPIVWLRAHPFAADLTFALLLTTLAVTFHVLDLEQDDAQYTAPSWWTVPLVILALFPIAWRRTNTIVATAVVVVAEITASLASIDGTGFIGVVIALYSLGAHSTGRVRTRLLWLVATGIALLFVAGWIEGEADLGALVFSTVILVTAFVLGDNLRRRREAANAVLERAERAERERELIASQRVSAERSRIARELHDVVAHSVSVMVIQAAAARRSLSSSPANAEQALSNIEETGRQTMNELRGILGVLRDVDVDSGDTPDVRAPQPTLADIESLVTVADDLPITLSTSGDLTDLPSSTTLTGYRVVQESLTNVRRHAGLVERVTIDVRREPDAVRITVCDDGRGAAAEPAGTGYGVVGMRERVGAVGGSIEVGSRVGGGWRVDARLPADVGASGVRRPDAEEVSA